MAGGREGEMSAFVVETSHIDFMLSAGLARPRNVLRWYDVDPAQEMDEDCYREGSWIGPGALAWHQLHARELRDDTADRVGQMLLAENRLSVNHRYAEGEMEEFYVYREVRGPFDPRRVINACQGYNYQSCEHPSWWKSEARQFVEALQAYYVAKLVGDSGDGWHVTPDEVSYETAVKLSAMARKAKRNTN